MSSTETTNVTSLFLAFSHHKLLEQYLPRLRSCVESLTDEQVWWRPNETSNSVGNLLLHLNGNVRQWLLAPFKHLQDTRDRPSEFNQTGQIPASALLERLAATVHEASDVLLSLTEADLLARFEIQGYKVCGLEAVYQVVEHFGLHYGQIVYATKLLRNADLGFYKELTKTGRPS